MSLITGISFFHKYDLKRYEAVFALARLNRQDTLAIPDITDRDRANRHSAYRQFRST